MTRQLCTTNSVNNSRSYSRSRIAKKNNLRTKFKRFINGALDILSAVAAWFYAVCYTAFWLAVCALVVAGFVVVWDVLIMCGDPTASWGPGGAYEIFWFCLGFIKWSAIGALVALAFFGGTRVLGVIFRDAYEGAYQVNKTRAKGYMVLAIMFFLPSVGLTAFIENAEDHFGTAQLIDLVIERI